jgi:thioredoxin 1
MSYLPHILIGLMLVFVLFQMLPLVRAYMMRGKPMPDVAGLIDAGLLGEERLLFYFTSPRCPMCRSMTPVIERLAAQHANIIKVDVSESMALARKFGVMGTPTLVLVRAGKVDRMLVGAKSEKQVRALLLGNL